VVVRIKGAREYEKFKKGMALSRKEAMLAQCYVCNGLEESRADCMAGDCPLYEYHPHRGRRTAIKRPLATS